MAYDQLKRQYAGGADKQYLKILELAARENESLVEAAIGRLCDLSQAMSFEAVEAWVLCGQKLAAPTAVRVDEVDLSAGRTVYFTSTNLLVQELLLAKRELRLPKAIQKLSRYQALLLDDLGYVQQSREEMEVLFTLLAERYERGSVLITSNLPFSKWESIFKDAMTTAAAIDRLVHHSVILELNLPSYRVEQAKKSKAAGSIQTPPPPA